jgi:general secretion pathway protein C
MKRLPLLASFLLFIALCASAAYWGMQLFKPPLRAVAAPPRAAKADIRPEAAVALFGGKSGAVAASNYQLKGVIFSGSPHDSIAILSADGKPAQAIRVDTEVAPGVKIKEVHREYVLLTEGGVIKRVQLPESAKGQAGLASTAPAPARTPVTPGPSQVVPGRAAQLSPPPPPPATTAPPTVVVSPPPSATTPAVQPPAAAVAPAPVPPPTVVAPAPVGSMPPSAATIAPTSPAPVGSMPPPATTTAPASPAGTVAAPPASMPPAATYPTPITPGGAPAPRVPLQSR